MRGFKCTEQKKTQNQNTVFVFRMVQFEACHRNKVHIIILLNLFYNIVLNILLAFLHIWYGCVEYDLIMDCKMLNMYSVLSNFQYYKNGGKTEEIKAFLEVWTFMLKKQKWSLYTRATLG